MLFRSGQDPDRNPTLLALADLGARLAGGIPVGILTALIGAPFFIWLLRRSRTVRPVVTP